jgi:hypothetical protein
MRVSCHQAFGDGYRMIVRRDRPSVRLYSRNAYYGVLRLVVFRARGPRQAWRTHWPPAVGGAVGRKILAWALLISGPLVSATPNNVRSEIQYRKEETLNLGYCL